MTEVGGFPTQWMVSPPRRKRTVKASYFIHTKNCGTELAQIQHVRRLLDDVGWIALVEENRERQFLAAAGSYPVGYGLYARLKSGSLGFSPAARFKTNPGAGPVEFSRPYDEPTMTAFDHPTVMIYRRDRQGSRQSRPGPMGGQPAQRGRTPARRGGGGDPIGEHRGGEGTPSPLHPAPSRRTGRAVPAGGGIRERRLPEDERGPVSLLHGSRAQSAARVADAGAGPGNGRAVHPPCRFQNANCTPGGPVPLGRSARQGPRRAGAGSRSFREGFFPGWPALAIEIGVRAPLCWARPPGAAEAAFEEVLRVDPGNAMAIKGLAQLQTEVAEPP